MQENNEILNPLVSTEPATELSSDLIPFAGSAHTTVSIINDDEEPVFENPLPEDSEETKELTEEEKREFYIKQLKESKIRFKPIKHFATKTTTVVTEELDVMGKPKKRRDTEILTNVTRNQFGAEYHKKRQRKNKMQKASRKLSRKK